MKRIEVDSWRWVALRLAVYGASTLVAVATCVAIVQWMLQH